MSINEKSVLENISGSGVEVSKRVFQDSAIRNCELEAYRLTGCQFENGGVIDSHIVRSILDGGTLNKCHIMNTTLEENGMWNLEMKNCIWQDVNVIALDFVNTKLIENSFKEQKLEVVFVNEAYLENNDFSKSEWSRLIVRRSNFINNNFSDCKINCRQMEYTNFVNNNIDGSEWIACPFKRCTFKKMDFRNAKFLDVQFIQCKFEDCLYTEEQAAMFGLA